MFFQAPSMERIARQRRILLPRNLTRNTDLELYLSSLTHLQKSIIQNSVNFNPSSGLLFLRISPNSPFSSDHWIHDRFIAFHILKSLLNWANPQKQAPESLLELFRQFCLRTDTGFSMRAEQGHALLSPLKRTGMNNWCIGRQPPDQKDLRKRIKVENGLLWDSRYKLRVLKQDMPLFIRPVLDQDWSVIKKHNAAYQIFRNIPFPLRSTIACIANQDNEIIGLPSFNMNFTNRCKVFANFQGLCSF